MIDSGTARVTIKAPSRLITIAFTLTWLCGWLLVLTVSLLDSVRWGTHLFSLLGFVVVIGGGVPAAFALLWAAGGKREDLNVSAGRLTLERSAGPFRRTRTFEPSSLRNLRVVPGRAGLLADFIAVREFWSGGAGRVAFDAGGRSYAVGTSLTEDQAAAIVAEIGRVLPEACAPIALEGREQRAHTRRQWVAAYMTMAMLVFGIRFPLGLAVTDRSICFCDDSVVPRTPIDVSTRRPGGRVYLVPIDDFPADRAQAIAEHFRARFGVPIDVAPALAWPGDAYVERRRQMNSEAMLTLLETTYPRGAERIVAIGLTNSDMFNPHVNWRYVFSYRRNNRVAVVSPARMDRGCLGVFPADEERMLSRMRKMIGKNIGIMYFGLEVSSDPASLLYATIGGPQELDAMSEWF
jgi:predicted Zn-dependent protease